MASEIVDRRGGANTLENLGTTYVYLGDFSQGIKHYLLALEIDRAIGYQTEEATDLWNLSLVFDKIGNQPQAIDNAEAALQIRLRLGDTCAEKVRWKLEQEEQWLEI
jgi:tetratricopeptide (TPR) repeat protein